MTATRHPWSAWYPIHGGALLERRCGHCGTVERITYEGLNAEAIERLDSVVAAFRRAFPT